MKNSNGEVSNHALIPQFTELEGIRALLCELIDYAIVEGAMIKAPQFIHYLEMARLEIEHWQPPCPCCGHPMREGFLCSKTRKGAILK